MNQLSIDFNERIVALGNDLDWVIYGTGRYAAEVIYLLEKMHRNPKYVVEHNAKVQSFCGFEVREAQRECLTGKFIIAAYSTWAGYDRVRNNLRNYGLDEFKDFVYGEWLFKKIVWLHGNCHMEVLESFFNSSSRFDDKYSIYHTPMIFEYPNNSIEGRIAEFCDVWIHQDIRVNNSYGYKLSDEYIRTIVNSYCKEITILNLYGMGEAIFPYRMRNAYSNFVFKGGTLNNGKDGGMFPQIDYILNRLFFDQEGDVEQVIQMALDIDLLNKEEVESNYMSIMEKFRKRDENVDVKICDFVDQNMLKHKLFYDCGHPTNYLLKELAIRILEKLGIDDSDISSDVCMDDHELPIYPSVAKILEFEWKDDLIRKSNRGCRCLPQMNFREYVKEYIWWTIEPYKKKLFKLLLGTEEAQTLFLYPKGELGDWIFNTIKKEKPYMNICYLEDEICAIQKSDENTLKGVCILASDLSEDYNRLKQITDNSLYSIEIIRPFIEEG